MEWWGWLLALSGWLVAACVGALLYNLVPRAVEHGKRKERERVQQVARDTRPRKKPGRKPKVRPEQPQQEAGQ